MTTKRLRFYAKGTAQVTDPHAQERNLRRCVGRRWQEVLPGRWAWVPTGEPQEIDYHPDLVKAVKDGDLWPADAETAKAIGVPYDDAFTGDAMTETIKAYKAKKAAEAAPPPKEDKPKPGGKVDV
jgi:hypothetical protein